MISTLQHSIDKSNQVRKRVSKYPRRGALDYHKLLGRMANGAIDARHKAGKLCAAKSSRLPNRTHRRRPGHQPALAIFEIAFEVGDSSAAADYAGVGGEPAFHDGQDLII